LHRRARLLLDKAIGEAPVRAEGYLREIVALGDEAPPGWWDLVATDYPKLLPMLRQIDWNCIRDLLDLATGQRSDDEKLYLREVVALAEKGWAPPDWRDMVATHYPKLVSSLDWVTQYDVYGEPRKPTRSGRKRELTEEESKLITDYLPLVRGLAVERASEINNLAGGTSLDHELLADLERVGLQVLEEVFRRWDPTRRVTFGAFVRKRVAGEMDNYLTRKRIKTVNSDADAPKTHADARERWKSEAHGTRAKGNRTSAGGRKVKSYAETGPKWHPSRLIPRNPIPLGTALAEALAQLTPNQRAVALEKRARQRVTELLRGN
jgi:hypothetical protein